MKDKIKNFIIDHAEAIIGGLVGGVLAGGAYVLGIKLEDRYLNACIIDHCINGRTVECISKDGTMKYIVSHMTKAISKD